MTSKFAPAGRFSLRRWSQRKLEVARAKTQVAPAIVAAAPTPLSPETLPPGSPGKHTEVPLPPIESLTIESDFAPFFRPQVDESIKRAALKQLFRDPRFNIMDGLDTYIDDYTRPDPIPSAMLEGLMQRRVSFVLPEAEAPAAPTAVAATRDPSAPAADAIAPPVAKIEPILSGSIDLDLDKTREMAHPPPDGGTGAQTGKP
jgi:Protein of unknown function (DUF3306)